MKCDIAHQVVTSRGNGRAGSMPWSGRWKKEKRCWKSGEWSRQEKPLKWRAAEEEEKQA